MPVAPDPRRPIASHARAAIHEKTRTAACSPFSVRGDPLEFDGFGVGSNNNKIRHPQLRCDSVQSDEGGEEKASVFNMADFYESIPDYNDINHLSESDFYSHLEGLKRKQAILRSTFVDTSTCPGAGEELRDIEGCEPPAAGGKISFCDDRFAMYPSAAVGRLEGPNGKKPRSKSAGSLRPSRTVISPFRMSKREDEESMMRELSMYRHGRCTSADPRCSPKRKSHSKGLNVPYTSKYPMYDQIVADQVKRSEIVKLNSKIELQSKMKPFHFYTSKTKKCSDNPDADGESLLAYKPLSPRPFRARPCPQSMFSNYFYNKLWEEEQFRAMARKIRSEEMLKASSLPASMRKRQVRCNATIGCGASADMSPSEGSFNRRGFSGAKVKRSKRIKRKVGGHRVVTPERSSFITTSPSPFQFETAKRCSSRKSDKNSDIASSVTVTTTDKVPSRSQRSTSPKPIYPAARPNLAANLREEVSRKKICEMSCSPNKNPFPRDTTVRPNWGVRKTPAWKSLYYDFTNDEDISMRLSTRRAEERMRQEEHHINMELMRQRVRATPLLLEGHTSLPNTLTGGVHRCDPPPPPPAHHRVSSCSARSRAQSAQHHQVRGHSRNVSALSNYSDLQCGGGSSIKEKFERQIRRSIQHGGFGSS